MPMNIPIIIWLNGLKTNTANKTTIKIIQMSFFFFTNSLTTHATPNLNQLLHHAIKISAAVLRAEGVVQLFVKRVKFLIGRVRLGVRLVNFRLQTRHPFLRRGVILVRA